MTSKKDKAEPVRLTNPNGVEVTVSAESADQYLAKGYKRAGAKSAAKSKD